MNMTRQDRLIGLYDTADTLAGVGRFASPACVFAGSTLSLYGTPLAPHAYEAGIIGAGLTLVSQYERNILRPRWLAEGSGIIHKLTVYGFTEGPRIFFAGYAVNRACRSVGLEPSMSTSLLIGAGISVVTEASKRFRNFVDGSVLPSLSGQAQAE